MRKKLLSWVVLGWLLQMGMAMATTVNGGVNLVGVAQSVSVGTINFKGGNFGVQAFAGGLVGRAQSVSAGFIKFDNDGVVGVNAGVVTDWGVVRTGNILSGEAFNASMGFIHFRGGTGNPSCDPAAAIDLVNYGVCIVNNSELVGRAWSDNSGWVEFSAGGVATAVGQLVSVVVPASVGQLNVGGVGSVQANFVQDLVRRDRIVNNKVVVAETKVDEGRLGFYVYCEDPVSLVKNILNAAQPVLLTGAESRLIYGGVVGQGVDIYTFPSLNQFVCGGNFVMVPAINFSALVEGITSGDGAVYLPRVTGRASAETVGNIKYCRSQLFDASTGEMLSERNLPADPSRDFAVDVNDKNNPLNPKVGDRLYVKLSNIRDSRGNFVNPQSVTDGSFAPMGRGLLSIANVVNGDLTVKSTDTLAMSGGQVTGSSNVGFNTGVIDAVLQFSDSSQTMPWDFERQGAVTFTIDNLLVNGLYNLDLGLSTDGTGVSLPQECGALSFYVAETTVLSCPVIAVNGASYQASNPACDTAVVNNVAATNKMVAPLSVVAGTDSVTFSLSELGDRFGNLLTPTSFYSKLKIEVVRERDGDNVVDATMGDEVVATLVKNIGVNGAGTIDPVVLYPYKAGKYKFRYAYCDGTVNAALGVYNDGACMSNGVVTTPSLFAVVNSAPSSYYKSIPNIEVNVEQVMGTVKPKLPRVADTIFTKAVNSSYGFDPFVGVTPATAQMVAGEAAVKFRIADVTDRFGNFVVNGGHTLGADLMGLNVLNKYSVVGVGIDVAGGKGSFLTPNFAASVLTATDQFALQIYQGAGIYLDGSVGETSSNVLEVVSNEPDLTNVPSLRVTFANAGTDNRVVNNVNFVDTGFNVGIDVPSYAVAGVEEAQIEIDNVVDKYGNKFTVNHPILTGAGIGVDLVDYNTMSLAVDPSNLAAGAYQNDLYVVKSRGTAGDGLRGSAGAFSFVIPAAKLRYAGNYQVVFHNYWDTGAVVVGAGQATNTAVVSQMMVNTAGTVIPVMNIWAGRANLNPFMAADICDVVDGASLAGTGVCARAVQGYPSLESVVVANDVGKNYVVAGESVTGVKIKNVVDEYGNVLQSSSPFYATGVLVNDLNFGFNLRTPFNVNFARDSLRVDYNNGPVTVVNGMVDVSAVVGDFTFVDTTNSGLGVSGSAFVVAGEYDLFVGDTDGRYVTKNRDLVVFNAGLDAKNVRTEVRDPLTLAILTAPEVNNDYQIRFSKLTDVYGNGINYWDYLRQQSPSVLDNGDGFYTPLVNKFDFTDIARQIFMPTNAAYYVAGASLTEVAMKTILSGIVVGARSAMIDFDSNGEAYVYFVMPAVLERVAGFVDLNIDVSLSQPDDTKAALLSSAITAVSDQANRLNSVLIGALEVAGYVVDAPFATGSFVEYSYPVSSLYAGTVTAANVSVRALSNIGAGLNDTPPALSPPHASTVGEYYNVFIHLVDGFGNTVMSLGDMPMMLQNAQVVNALDASGNRTSNFANSAMTFGLGNASANNFGQFSAFNTLLPTDVQTQLFGGRIPNISDTSFYNTLSSDVPTSVVVSGLSVVKFLPFDLSFDFGMDPLTVVSYTKALDDVADAQMGLSYLSKDMVVTSTCIDKIDNDNNIFHYDSVTGLLSSVTENVSGIDAGGYLAKVILDDIKAKIGVYKSFDVDALMMANFVPQASWTGAVVPNTVVPDIGLYADGAINYYKLGADVNCTAVGGGGGGSGGSQVTTVTGKEGPTSYQQIDSASRIYHRNPASDIWDDVKNTDILLRRQNPEDFRVVIKNVTAQDIYIPDINVSALSYDPAVVEDLKKGNVPATADSIMPTRSVFYDTTVVTSNDAKRLRRIVDDKATRLTGVYNKVLTNIDATLVAPTTSATATVGCQTILSHAWKTATDSTFNSGSCNVAVNGVQFNLALDEKIGILKSERGRYNTALLKYYHDLGKKLAYEYLLNQVLDTTNPASPVINKSVLNSLVMGGQAGLFANTHPSFDFDPVNLVPAFDTKKYFGRNFDNAVDDLHQKLSLSRPYILTADLGDFYKIVKQWQKAYAAVASVNVVGQDIVAKRAELVAVRTKMEAIMVNVAGLNVALIDPSLGSVPSYAGSHLQTLANGLDETNLNIVKNAIVNVDLTALNPLYLQTGTSNAVNNAVNNAVAKFRVNFNGLLPVVFKTPPAQTASLPYQEQVFKFNDVNEDRDLRAIRDRLQGISTFLGSNIIPKIDVSVQHNLGDLQYKENSINNTITKLQNSANTDWHDNSNTLKLKDHFSNFVTNSGLFSTSLTQHIAKPFDQDFDVNLGDVREEANKNDTLKNYLTNKQIINGVIGSNSIPFNYISNTNVKIININKAIVAAKSRIDNLIADFTYHPGVSGTSLIDGLYVKHQKYVDSQNVIYDQAVKDYNGQAERMYVALTTLYDVLGRESENLGVVPVDTLPVVVSSMQGAVPVVGTDPSVGGGTSSLDQALAVISDPVTISTSLRSMQQVMADSGGTGVVVDLTQKLQASKTVVTNVRAGLNTVVGGSLVAGVSSLGATDKYISSFDNVALRVKNIGSTGVVKMLPLAFDAYDKVTGPDFMAADRSVDPVVQAQAQTTIFKDMHIKDIRKIDVTSIVGLKTVKNYDTATVASSVLCSVSLTTNCFELDSFKNSETDFQLYARGQVNLGQNELLYIDFTATPSLPVKYVDGCFVEQVDGMVGQNAGIGIDLCDKNNLAVGESGRRWGGYVENKNPIERKYSYIYAGVSAGYRYFTAQDHAPVMPIPIGVYGQVDANSRLMKVITPSIYLAGLQSFTRKDEAKVHVTSSLSQKDVKTSLFDMALAARIKKYVAKRLRGAIGVGSVANFDFTQVVVTEDGDNDIYYYDRGAGTNDLVIDGATDTVVVGGKKVVVTRGINVYIKDNVVYGADGVYVLVVLKDAAGNGGNIYVDPEVRNLDGILFAEGKVQSARDWNNNNVIEQSITPAVTYQASDGSSISFSNEVFTATTEFRQFILSNQLYIRGNIIAQNTLGGSLQSPMICAAQTNCDFNAAVADDILRLREFAVSHPYGQGVLDVIEFNKIVRSDSVGRGVIADVKVDGVVQQEKKGYRSGDVLCADAVAPSDGVCASLVDRASALPNVPCGPLSSVAVCPFTGTTTADYNGRIAIFNAAVYIDGQAKYDGLKILSD